MVLVFQCKRTQNSVKDRKSRDIRKRFINELITNGLQIEIERIQHLVRDFYFAIELLNFIYTGLFHHSCLKLVL
jgi:hypothetical protein